MRSTYRIFGSEMSPYSVKVRFWFRYKDIPHEWLLRNGETRAEYEQFAKLPIVPLVVTPDSQGLQDTPLIETLEEDSCFSGPIPRSRLVWVFGLSSARDAGRDR
jgi:hypothetical protein